MPARTPKIDSVALPQPGLESAGRIPFSGARLRWSRIHWRCRRERIASKDSPDGHRTDTNQETSRQRRLRFEAGYFHHRFSTRKARRGISCVIELRSGLFDEPTQTPVTAPTISPIGPAIIPPAKPPAIAPANPLSNFACLRFSGFKGAHFFPFQPRAVRVVLLLLSQLQLTHAANRLLR